MDRIERIKISNYKGFKKSITIMGISNVLVLIGKNDIGKTSILECLNMVSNQQTSEPSMCNGWDFNKTGKTVVIEVKLATKSGKTHSKIEYSYNGGNPLPTISATKRPNVKYISLKDTWSDIDLGKSVDTLKADVNNAVNNFYLVDNKDLKEELNKMYESIENNGSYILDNCILDFSQENGLDIDADYQIAPEELLSKKDEIMAKADNYLQNHTDKSPQVKEIVNKIKDKIDNKAGVRISSRGSGINRLTYLYYNILLARTQYSLGKADLIYVIDEPEASLYPSMQIDLVKALKAISNHNQVIVATHSSTIAKEFCEKTKAEENYNDIIGETVKIIKEAQTKIIAEKPKSQSLNYLSINEVNYIAFDEITPEYHIELFGFIHNKLQERYKDTSFRYPQGETTTFEDWWNTNIGTANDRKVFNISGIDEWFRQKIGSSFTPITKTGRELLGRQKVINTDGSLGTNVASPNFSVCNWVNTKTKNWVNNTICCCVRNQIDHPMSPGTTTADKIKYNNNIAFVHRDILLESITIMRKLIDDEPYLFRD